MLDVVFILDKSGSMSGSRESTISSFNEYLEKEKKNSFDTRITTILFSDRYSFLHKQKMVKNVKMITPREYVTEGCTALYDAIGEGISFMDHNASDKVLFIIMTDGYENASKEYDKKKIQSLIRSHSDWEFVYVGADIDSYAAGGELGIRKDNIANFQKSKTGLSKLFHAFEDYECAMMDEDTSSDWKRNLED